MVHIIDKLKTKVKNIILRNDKHEQFDIIIYFVYLLSLAILHNCTNIAQ